MTVNQAHTADSFRFMDPGRISRLRFIELIYNKETGMYVRQ